MRLHDISRWVTERAPVYPGDARPAVVPLREIGPDAACTLQGLVDWTTHVLTHLDAPKHFVPGGDALDDLPLDTFVGPALVVGVTGPAVEPDDVPDEDLAGLAVLFRTRNSERADDGTYDEDHVYISGPAAEALASRRPRLVGIDYSSADRCGDETFPAHRALLGAGVVLLEGAHLGNVEPGRYELIALPLAIPGADGSPVRAVLRQA